MKNVRSREEASGAVEDLSGVFQPAADRLRKLHMTRSLALALLFPLPFALAACTKDEKPRGDVPPPPASAAQVKAGACEGGGGQVNDPVSAGLFPRAEGGYCLDPQGETKTYGEKGKYSMDEVCTTAFDGDCEIYKKFGLKRVVALRYVDGAGKGGTVDVVLSQFTGVAGAFGMYTMRIVAGDPTDPSTPRSVAVAPEGASVGGAAVMGTGRAYVWRGSYLAELQYNNDQETPAQLKASSASALTALSRGLAGKLPEEGGRPASVRALPEADLVPNGVQFFPREPFGWKNVSNAAVGFYKQGDRRWRAVTVVAGDVDQAKDIMKTLKQLPGSIPVTGAGEDAVHVVVPGSKGAPKVEILVARKGHVVAGAGDEEYALKDLPTDKSAAARLSKEEAIAKVKAMLDKPASAPAPATTGSALKK